jgi:hypothetical protein
MKPPPPKFSQSSSFALRACVAVALIAAAAFLLRPGTPRPTHRTDLPLLRRQIDGHMERVNMELQAMFDRMCKPNPPVSLPSIATQRAQSDGLWNLNLPSCIEITTAELDPYYGNMFMLLIEAWRGKIIPTLEAMMEAPVERQPQAALLTVDADGMRAGAIYVQQLHHQGQLTRTAMMIGIHRLPKHKMLKVDRAMGTIGRSTVVVTDKVIDRVRAWGLEHRMTRLIVCPYQEIKGRVRKLGFQPVDDLDGFTFGELALKASKSGGVCEESSLYALALPDR